MNKISNEEVLAQVNETRNMLNSIWTRKHHWIGHVLWHDKLLCNAMEGRMIGKTTRSRRRLQVLEVLKTEVHGEKESTKNLLYSRQLQKKNKTCHNALYTLKRR